MKKQTIASELEPYYEVEEITNKRKLKGRYQYLVKWIGWEKPTWQPEQNLSDVADMIYEFNQQRKKKNNNNVVPCNKRRERKQNEEIDQQFQDKEIAHKKKSKKIRLKTFQETSRNDLKSNIIDVYSSQEEYEQKRVYFKKQTLRGINLNNKTQTVIPDESIEDISQQHTNEPNIYFHPIRKIRQLKLINNKWMIQVEFESTHLSNLWIERDLARVLYPLKMLQFYEVLLKSSNENKIDY